MTCPVCGGLRVHHSRLRSWVERLRWRLTACVPYRCHDCEWRGWRKDAPVHQGAAIREIRPELTADELDDLDQNVDA